MTTERIGLAGLLQPELPEQERGDLETYGPANDRRLDEEGDHIAIADYASYVWSGWQECYIPRSEVVHVNGRNGPISLAYASDNYYLSEIDDEYYVDSSDMPENQEIEEEEADLFSYSADVFDHFEPTFEDKDLVFGVELEMEAIDGRSVSEVVNVLGGKVGKGFILKDDGSLENGVELVTMPRTLEQHIQAFTDNDTVLTKQLYSCAHSGAGTSRCGMHVHINRGALTPMTLGKMLVFINSEQEAMESLLTVIAQRTRGRWCTRMDKKITDGLGSSDDSSHYESLSISSKGTAELRIFRGNLRPERVAKNIEFAHALVMYCRQASMLKLESAAAFLAWLEKNRHFYPYLCKFLVEKQVLHSTKTATTNSSEEI